MNKSNNTLPVFRAHQFACPYCGVFAQQNWNGVNGIANMVNDALNRTFLDYRTKVDHYGQKTLEAFHKYTCQEIPELLRTNFLSERFAFSKCQSCSNTAVWLDQSMIYPIVSTVPEPNKDLDNEIKVLYREAKLVHPLSARSAAALLRLCIEKLCVQAGETGTLNQQIKNLVKKGVSQQIQQALDYCRVIGNSAVHPGKIDIEEDPERVPTLFNLINDIAQEMITKPREMKEKYASLPTESIDQIEKRDDN